MRSEFKDSLELLRKRVAAARDKATNAARTAFAAAEAAHQADAAYLDYAALVGREDKDDNSGYNYHYRRKRIQDKIKDLEKQLSQLEGHNDENEDEL